MIISHEHRFVFVELPRTGCTAVGKELIESYGGMRILRKHSSYDDFARQATPDERSYFAFSSIRNPMDDAVSGYFKLASDHHGRYSDEMRRRYRVGNRGADTMRANGTNAKGLKPQRRKISERRDNRRYDYITKADCDFAHYFMRFYRAPYDTWSRTTHRKMDHIIRFERIDDDFEEALEKVGLDLVRPLPVRNRTDAKRGEFLSYYTPETRARAAWVFGPYMRDWGYEFPSDWDVGEPALSSRAAYHALSIPRRAYWRFFR